MARWVQAGVLGVSAWVLALWSDAPASQCVWIEAEQFRSLGGWTLDAQFVDQMGSPYLLAVGLGSPVKDAETRVTLPAAGTYRVWARTRDWVPDQHPGCFQLLLNGAPVDHVFGRTGQPGWHWEDGGMHTLPEVVDIGLHDLSGYYGRCDAIVLANDLQWVPSDDPVALADLRMRQGGVSADVTTHRACDVVVVGGGLAGCTAAVAAARNGATVVLLQNRPLLGGNASTEVLVPPVGVSPGVYRSRFPLDPAETGLVEEYRTAGNQRVSEGQLYSKRLDRFVRQQTNLDLFLNTHATGVEMEEGGQRIASVLALDVQSGRRMRFPAAVFVDCTGDATVGVAAGAEYRHGKEPRSLHNEPWAPEVASRETMGNGLKYAARLKREPQPFATPAWCYQFPSCADFSPGRHPQLPNNLEIGYQWVIELGGTRDTYADSEEIRDDLLRLIYGLWDHTKNRCDKLKEEAAHYELAWVGHVAGKRENRRLIGDYVLTQNDIAQQTLFSDRVAFGGWLVDDHYSAGFFHHGSFGPHYDDKSFAYTGQPYSIPLRCLYSKNVDNLLMAGRNISASHLALANTRVMLTCAVIGQAAGTAAAFCAREHASPREIGERRIVQLQQQLLKEGAYLIGLRSDDPRNLASSAVAHASSTRTSMTARLVADGFDRAVADDTHAWAPASEASAPHWVELAWDRPVQFNVVHVCFQTVNLSPRQFALEVWQADHWLPIATVTENRHRRHVLGLDRLTTDRLRLVLQEPLAVCEIRVYDEPHDVVQTARRAHANMRLRDEGPWLPWNE
jgi:hypothetical protein